MATKTSYVNTLAAKQIEQLREILVAKGWVFADAPYAHWRAKLDKTSVVAYQSGKLTAQGRGTADFVQFILEPEVLGEVRFGYEHILAEQENPEMFEPHAGIDESGKGDYFGPLVIATAYVDGPTARTLLEAGVADSKTIKSDRKIRDLAEIIRRELCGRFSVVPVGPEAYNRLYSSFRNVNRLLAWGHAKSLENLLEKVPDCPRAISDQFGRKETVLRALQERGRKIELIQRTKAESDIAVAAASILARAEFVQRLEQLGHSAGVTLPKGAGTKVLETAREMASRGGRKALEPFAKMHFRTTYKALGIPEPPRES
ncbi:MAG: ribonuclease HIII [Lentisphaeria bacterium]|nr:ribonuclease HIII [Lentisphaeria bacterium]